MQYITQKKIQYGKLLKTLRRNCYIDFNVQQLTMQVYEEDFNNIIIYSIWKYTLFHHIVLFWAFVYWITKLVGKRTSKWYMTTIWCSYIQNVLLSARNRLVSIRSWVWSCDIPRVWKIWDQTSFVYVIVIPCVVESWHIVVWAEINSWYFHLEGFSEYLLHYDTDMWMKSS